LGSVDFGSIILQIVIFALAITVHESAHAWSADRFGDPTARMLGRISLNPLAHLDIFGTVIFPILLAISGMPIFGWAKPVPVNPLNLRRPRRDSAWISAAGPLSNIALALPSILLFRLVFAAQEPLLEVLGKETLIGILMFLRWNVIINIILAAFNAIPIPPLDGGGILAGLLPDSALGFLDFIRPYGFFILIALMFSGAIGVYIRVVLRLTNVMLGLA